MALFQATWGWQTLVTAQADVSPSACGKQKVVQSQHNNAEQSRVRIWKCLEHGIKSTCLICLLAGDIHSETCHPEVV